MNKPLVLAVVGHTNVGKTSLLRTLTRDIHFGHVSDRPSTTRHVEGARLIINDTTLIELYDTPGLEDAISLYGYLERIALPKERLDGPDKLKRFLAGPEAKGRFEQEAKVLRKLLASDAGLYVIDVREPILPKYHDELAVLADCGKPLLPVFNFVANEHAHEEEWRRALSRLGLHASVRFDTLSPPSDGERRLYESLILLIETARQPLTHLIEDLQRQQLTRRHAAANVIADTLLDVAAYSRWINKQSNQTVAINTLHTDIRQHEQKAIEKILQLYKFNVTNVLPVDFPLCGGRFVNDLFSPEALKQMGIRLGMGFAAGAAAGAGIDLVVGGLTLGAAALVGALVGGTSQGIKHYGPQLLGKLKGGYKLSVDDAILCLLALRLNELQQALEARGHAAQSELELNNPYEEKWKHGKLPEPLLIARAHPTWSQLNPAHLRHDARRSEALTTLTHLLLNEADLIDSAPQR